MKTPALIAALLVARAGVVLSVHPVAWSPEFVVACLGQDALVALIFLMGETALRRCRVGRRATTFMFWTIVGYVALNVAVVRVLPTPLTWPMWQAAGAPIADSIRLYATWQTVVAVALVLLSALAGARVAPGMPPITALVTAGILVCLSGVGAWAQTHVDTRGAHRNAVVTLVVSGRPAIAAAGVSDMRKAEAHWRTPFGATVAVREPPALSGLAAGRHVVVIGLESVGAQYLKTYGAGENVMPWLDELAREGVVFDQVSAVSPDSIRSLFSVMCSRYPALDTPVEAYASGPCDSLASRLRGHGYHTAMFHSGRFAYLGMTGVIRDRGFDVLEDAGHIGGQHESSFGVDEISTVARMLAWIDTLPDNDQFLLTYLPVAGHHPYVFSGHGAFGAATDLDRYRSALHEGDAAIGALIDGLRSRGLFEQTLFVVYGDHGQAFAQHPGNVGHTFFLFEENVRVPLFLSMPGTGIRGQRTDATASLIDVTPTVFDLLGLSAGQDHHGVSALGGPRRTALFFTDYGDRLVGLRDGRWKLVHDLRAHTSRLFDLERDPGETRDVSSSEPARVSSYTDTVRAWSAAHKAAYLVSASPAEGRPTPRDRSLWCRVLPC